MFEILSICKGGGYRYCRTNPPHPKRNSKGLYPLHRVIAENKLGRLLEENEEVHHLDKDKTNDDPSNLIVLTKTEHAALHRQEEKPKFVEVVCGFCKKQFLVLPSIYRRRLNKSKMAVLYCSKSCGASHRHVR